MFLDSLLRASSEYVATGESDLQLHHALVTSAMAVGALEPYYRDQAIYELALVSARLAKDGLL